MLGGMSKPSLERAVELLSRTGSAEFERDIGGVLTVSISRVFGAHLTGTADRMRVVGGMELAGRVVVGGRRYRVTMMCERAVLETADDARIRLRATGVAEEGAETIVLASRQTLQRPARMTAIYCQDVVDGDVVDGTIVDLTRLGVTFHTTRLLRRGDRLFLRARFFAEPLETSVRVASTRTLNGSVVAECVFQMPTRELAETVERIASARQEIPEAAPLDIASMRRSLVVTQFDEGPWRRLLRRSG
jgi:hypothetical protein